MSAADPGGEKWRCLYCNHVYDPAEGDPENGIPPGTAFADLPEDWTCPECGAFGFDFRPVDSEVTA